MQSPEKVLGTSLPLSSLLLFPSALLPCRNLLQAYEKSDVFFISSPDKNSYKLSLLSMLSKKSGSPQQAHRRSRFVVFNMSKQQPIDVTMYPTHRLNVPHLQVCPLP